MAMASSWNPIQSYDRYQRRQEDQGTTWHNFDKNLTTINTLIDKNPSHILPESRDLVATAGKLTNYMEERINGFANRRACDDYHSYNKYVECCQCSSEAYQKWVGLYQINQKIKSYISQLAFQDLELQKDGKSAKHTKKIQELTTHYQALKGSQDRLEELIKRLDNKELPLSRLFYVRAVVESRACVYEDVSHRVNEQSDNYGSAGSEVEYSSNRRADRDSPNARAAVPEIRNLITQFENGHVPNHIDSLNQIIRVRKLGETYESLNDDFGRVSPKHGLFPDDVLSIDKELKKVHRELKNLHANTPAVEDFQLVMDDNITPEIPPILRGLHTKFLEHAQNADDAQRASWMNRLDDMKKIFDNPTNPEQVKISLALTELWGLLHTKGTLLNVNNKPADENKED